MQGSISFDGTLAGSIAGGGGGGTTPIISADATVDSLSGDPTCTVSRTGTDEMPTFHFAFSGIVGEEGPEGPEGPEGQQGPAGEDGADGTDGVTPEVTASATVNSSTGTPSVTVTKSGTTAAPNFAFAFSNLKGETGATGSTGQQGPAGQDGTDGTDGTSAYASVSKSGNTATITCTDANGTTTAQISDGTDGQQGPAGVGVPTGGSTGDVLRKNSATNYDTYWDNLTALDIPYDNTSSGMTATNTQAAITELKSNLTEKVYFKKATVNGAVAGGSSFSLPTYISDWANSFKIEFYLRRYGRVGFVSIPTALALENVATDVNYTYQGSIRTCGLNSSGVFTVGSGQTDQVFIDIIAYYGTNMQS